mmetsp:Transcript_13333/g.26349  ORF Transcript_13333/g.26349 Transcript_13333/m.26349 type:complete len:262 (-) Transcript_13333:368-1153(-)
MESVHHVAAKGVDVLLCPHVICSCVDQGSTQLKAERPQMSEDHIVVTLCLTRVESRVRVRLAHTDDNGDSQVQLQHVVVQLGGLLEVLGARSSVHLPAFVLVLLGLACLLIVGNVHSQFLLQFVLAVEWQLVVEGGDDLRRQIPPQRDIVHDRPRPFQIHTNHHTQVTQHVGLQTTRQQGLVFRVLQNPEVCFADGLCRFPLLQIPHVQVSVVQSAHTQVAFIHVVSGHSRFPFQRPDQVLLSNAAAAEDEKCGGILLGSP